jgi:hypothetical protein
VVLVYQAYESAAYDYLADWEKAHPEFKAAQAAQDAAAQPGAGAAAAPPAGAH